MLKRFTKYLLIILLLTSNFGNIALAEEVEEKDTEDKINNIDLKYYEAVDKSINRIVEKRTMYNNIIVEDIYKIGMLKDHYSHKYHLLKLLEQGDSSLTEIKEIKDFILRYNNYLATYIYLEEFTKQGEDFVFEDMVGYLKPDQPNITEELEKTKTLIVDTAQRYNIHFITLTDKLNSYGTDEEIRQYLEKNLKDIRYLLSSYKELLEEHSDLFEDPQKIKDDFLEVYKTVMGEATRLDIKELMDLGMFEDIVEKTYEGKTEELYKELDGMSEGMLHMIALSATFRPLRTNINEPKNFEFLSNSGKAFHETFGGKRKFLFKPTERYNNITEGLHRETYKEMEIATLRYLIRDTKHEKILYVDNQEYTDEELKKLRQTGSAQEKVGEIVDNAKEKIEDTSDLIDNPIKYGANKVGEEIKGAAVDAWNYSTDFVKSSVKSLSDAFPIKNAEGAIKGIAFASADLSHYSELPQSVIDIAHNINENYMYLNNVVEQYSSSFLQIKLTNDMDKPLYIDPYGNILTSSGIVVIPAISNRTYFKAEAESYFFNVGFMESYPKFQPEIVAIKDEVAVIEMNVVKGDYDKIAISLDDENTAYISEANKEALHVDTTSLGKIKENIEVYSRVGDFRTISKMWDITEIPLNFLPLKDIVIKVSTGNNEGDEEGRRIIIRKVPKDNEVLNLFYNSNLQWITKREDTQLKDNNNILNSDYLFNNITKEIVEKGFDKNEGVSGWIPKLSKETYSKYIDLLTEQAENRYSTILSDDKRNNMLYTHSINEIEEVQGFLPLIYKLILAISIISIFIFIIASFVVARERYKQIIRIFLMLGLLTVLISFINTFNDNLINKPTKYMFANEIGEFFVMDQERNAHRRELGVNSNVKTTGVSEGLTLRLYKMPFVYDYTMPFTSSGNMTPTDYYMFVLQDQNRFKTQSVPMEVKGAYLTTTTTNVFSSSRIVVDPDTLKLKHQIPRDPEFAYYSPYYAFVDNLVHNLNLLSTINDRLPHTIQYADGSERTSGRVHSWVNSELFLDEKSFVQKVEKFFNEEQHFGEDSEVGQLTIANQKAELSDFLVGYGSTRDFLGISKLLGYSSLVEPFDEESLEEIKFLRWFPDLKYTEDGELIREKIIARKIEKVNEKTKQFMVRMNPYLDSVADEHAVKAIALYAALLFNREFSLLNEKTMPQFAELDNIPIQKYLQMIVVPKEHLLKNPLESYYSYVENNMGYFGITASTIHDWIIIGINFVKPFLIVMIWGLIAFVVYTKKILLPDPNNRSISGVVKVLLFYLVITLSYVLITLGIMRITNLTNSTEVAVGLSTVVALGYFLGLLYLIYVLVKDFMNLGSALLFKSASKAMQGMLASVGTVLSNIPLLYPFTKSKNFGMDKSIMNFDLDEKANNQFRQVGDFNPQRIVKYSKEELNAKSRE